MIELLSLESVILTCNVIMAVSPQTGWAPPRKTGNE